MTRLLHKTLPLLAATQRALHHLQAPALLAARVFVGMVFFRSGLTKIADWETTLFLFTDEYHVPLLPPYVAAVAGTFGELFFPADVGDYGVREILKLRLRQELEPRDEQVGMAAQIDGWAPTVPTAPRATRNRVEGRAQDANHHQRFHERLIGADKAESNSIDFRRLREAAQSGVFIQTRITTTS